jgi:hypothetical protein
MIVNNCTFICSEHYELIKREGCHDIRKKHEANFERWFRHQICIGGRNAENVPKQLYDLACGSERQVRSYRGCIVNGVRFHTKEYAQIRTTQNSGVVVRSEHKTSIIEYYGELKNILELRYPGQNRVYLFECDWWDTRSTRGIKIDHGFTIVNTSHKWYESDPFILATQAAQVFYLNDPKLGDSWKVVQKLTNRNIYDVPTVVERDNNPEMNVDVYQERVCVGGNIALVEDSTMLRRDDVTIAIDELYVQLDPKLFVDNNSLIEVHDTNSNDEEEFSSNYDTNLEHAEESYHENSSLSNSDTDSDDDIFQ